MPAAFVDFATSTARITRADGTVLEWCLLLADTDARRAQGLMGVDDLAGFDGMLFAWPEPTTGEFWMFDTRLPLSIAFFAADGGFVSATDMEPCPSQDPAACPSYPAEAPYTHAVEVTSGGLAEVGIGPGARAAFPGVPCRPA
jgi:uncharacterized membrane protein (UPF0127 family)